MKRIILLIAAGTLSLVSAFAQKPAGDPRGGISADMLRSLSTAYEGSPYLPIGRR